MSVLESIKPFWPLLFTFVLPRAYGYAQAVRVALRTRPVSRPSQPRPLSSSTRSSLLILVLSSALFIFWGFRSIIYTNQGAGYDNIFQTTRSRLLIPTDVLFTRLALARDAGGLTEMDIALRDGRKLSTLALRQAYLRFGPGTLLECGFCTDISSSSSSASDGFKRNSKNDEGGVLLSLVLYHLPVNVLVPHILLFLGLALGTTSPTPTPPPNGTITAGSGGTSKYRLWALLGAAALLLADISILLLYPVSAAPNESAYGFGLFWAMAFLRPLSLGLYAGLVATIIWTLETERTPPVLRVIPLIFSIIFGGGKYNPAGLLNGGGQTADPAATQQSLVSANVALNTAQAKLRAVHVLRNAVVRNARLKQTDDRYWHDVVQYQNQDGLGLGMPPAGDADGDENGDQEGYAYAYADVWDDEEVQAAIAHALNSSGSGSASGPGAGPGTVNNVAKLRSEVDSFVAGVTKYLD